MFSLLQDINVSVETISGRMDRVVGLAHAMYADL